MTEKKQPKYEISEVGYEGYRQVAINAGPLGYERIVPPAGEDYAFDVARWKRRVEVVVSPTGRSVRVFVDGVEVRR